MTDQSNAKASLIPPFKADVVGSLLRPREIIEARAAHGAGHITREELWKIESSCVARAVALQKAAGLQVCTDGEYHRRHWFMDFVERIELEGGADVVAYPAECRRIAEGGEVALGTGHKIVSADDLMALSQKALAEMGAKKARSSGDQNLFRFLHHM